jgi:hypothetical protein
MIVLVCGGRDFMNRDLIFKVLDVMPFQMTRVINGGATGADSIARLWALDRGVLVDTQPANWEKYGKAAGIIRNASMLEKYDIDLVIAFPGGRGTDDMMQRSKAAGVEVIRVEVNDGKPKCISSFSSEESILNT